MFDTGVKWLCDKNSIPREDITEQFEIDSYKGYIA